MRKRVGRPGFESGRRRGASAPSFSPDSLAGLQLWRDATDAGSITLNAGNVAQINDKSGNARHFSQATASQQPAYVSGQYIQFAAGGAGSNLLSGGIAASAVMSTTDNTLFIVLRADVGGFSSGTRFIGDGTFNGITGNGSGVLCRLWTGATGTSDRNLTLSEETKYIITIRRYGGGATLAASANGGTETSAAAGVALSSLAQNWNLPCNDSALRAAYRFYEDICYNVALSVAEVNQVGQYLATKHSLTWTDIS